MAQDVLSDGFVRLCISTDANWYGAKTRMIVEAQSINLAGVAYDALYNINSILDVAALFTPGTIMFEALAMALKRNGGSGLYQIVALPRADAGSAVAAVYKLPVTGPATSDGTITIFTGNSGYDISVDVVSGDSAAAIIAKIVAAYSAHFPYTVAAGVSADVGKVIFTAKHGGTIGNNLNLAVNWQGYRGVMPAGVTLGPLAQTTVGETNPTAPNYASIFGECCTSVYVLCSDDVTWQRGLRDWIRAAWDCSKPQCFGEGYTYRIGSTGSILASFDNSAELSVAAYCTGMIEWGWLKVVEYGGLSAATKELGRPEKIIQGPVNGLMNNILVPASCTRCWTFDQYTLLQENGFVTDGPTAQGAGVLVSPYIYNDVTEWLYDDKSRPNWTYRDVSSRRLASATALSIATFLKTFDGLSLYYKTTKIKQGVFGTNKNLMLAGIVKWAKGQVGSLFGEFDNIQTDITLTSDFDTSAPCAGTPGKLALNIKYRAPVRIREIDTNLVPQMLDNCVR